MILPDRCRLDGEVSRSISRIPVIWRGLKARSVVMLSDLTGIVILT